MKDTCNIESVKESACTTSFFPTCLVFLKRYLPSLSVVFINLSETIVTSNFDPVTLKYNFVLFLALKTIPHNIRFQKHFSMMKP